jgi:hypothetical protein
VNAIQIPARLFPLPRNVAGRVASQAREARFGFCMSPFPGMLKIPRPVPRAYAPAGVLTLPDNGQSGPEEAPQPEARGDQHHGHGVLPERRAPHPLLLHSGSNAKGTAAGASVNSPT